MAQENKTEVVVIGGGPGGYAAAFMAADLGLGVTLVDPEENPGGVCLYRGCIPSKSLLHVARLLTEAQEAEAWGVKFSSPDIDLDALRDWKDKVVARLTGGLGQLVKRRKIRHIRGTGVLTGNHSLSIQDAQNGTSDLNFDHAILATGSHAATLPDFPRDDPRILNSTSALEITEVPESLLVVGGGYIGLEIGTVFDALGSEVSVVEMTSGLLPGVDRDLVKILHKRLESRFSDIWLDTKVSKINVQKKAIDVKLTGKKGDYPSRKFGSILVAIGRRPNSENIGLEHTGIQTDDRGFIKVDSQCRTDEPNIYAIGDVVGEPMLAHKATHEGRTAAEVIAGKAVEFDPGAIPAVVFTDPEIAWCGLSEVEAREQGRDIQTAVFPWGASGRALSIGRSDGLTKLIFDPETERLLGMGVVGAGAGELIAEGVLAVEMAALARDVELTIHPHPTLSETIMGAAEIFLGTSTDVYRPAKKQE